MAEIPESSPNVIALTDKWLVLDKPPGWLSIPPSQPRGLRGSIGVLSKWAEERYGRIFIVHRIDRETSGVVLFARNPGAHREANRWFEGHQVRKTYQCLAWGAPRAPIFMLRKPIRGQASVTQIEVQERFGIAFLAQAKPMSGRRHQIRIHLSDEGHPILGDSEYKGPTQIALGDQPLVVSRVALHALRLELPTGERFESPWPEDFSSWVDRLRKDSRHAS